MNTRTLCFGTALSLILAATGASADPYEKPQNLKVLPQDLTAEQLAKTMKSFSLGVGIRCNECHVSQPGQSWQEYDYESDAKPLKEVGRQMLRMMNEINDRHLAQLERTDHERVSVTCVTCHRGQRLPRQMHEVLDETLAKSNVAAAIEKYSQLKKEYYGSQSFDFTELTLTEYARSLADRNRIDDAFRIARFATAEFPSGYQSRFLLGNLYLRQGDRDAARAEYEKALGLAPDQLWIREQLDRMKKD